MMDNDSSSEDEVFFGPVTDKEKRIAARYHGRKTLILPQRNPLYRRWSTTHIPSAFTIGEDETTLASPCDTPCTSDAPSQDSHSHELSQHHSRTDNSPLLSCNRRSNDDSKISSKSNRNSFETSQQETTLLSLTNSSCYSSENFADDEKSIYSTKLSNSSSLQFSTPMEVTQKHEQYLVTSPSHHSPAFPKIPPIKSTVTILQTPVLSKENVQDNLSSHHYDQSPHSPALATKKLVSTSDILSYSTSTELKTSAVSSKDLFDSFIELSVSNGEPEPDYHVRESSYKDPDSSTNKSSNDGTEPSLRLEQPLENYNESDSNLITFECHPRNALRNPRESDSSEVSNNPRKTDLKFNESPSTPRVSNFRISEDSCNSSQEFNCSVRNSASTSRGTDSQDISCIPEESDCILSESSNNSREPNCTKNASLTFPRELECSIHKEPDTIVCESSNVPRELDTTVSESLNMSAKSDATVNESPDISTKSDATLSESPDISTKSDATVSESPDISTKSDATLSESLNMSTKSDATVSESPDISTKSDATLSESLKVSTKSDDTVSQSPTIPKDPNTLVSGSSNIPKDSGCSPIESISTHQIYECSFKEADFSPREPKCCPINSDCSLTMLEHESDCSFKEPHNSPKGPGCSLAELHGNLDNQDGSPKELVNTKLNNSMEPLSSVRNLDDSSLECNSLTSFPSSPRFNDTLEEIELFMKYGMNYGEEKRSSMHQEHNISPSHSVKEPDWNLESPCMPNAASNNHREPPNSLGKPSSKLRESPSIQRESNCSSSEVCYQINKPKNSLPGVTINPVESLSSHGKPNYYSMESLTSLEKPGDSLQEFNASTSSHVSNKFYDSLEEEQVLKYRANYEDEGTVPSITSQEYTTPAHTSCSNNLEPPMKSNQTLVSFAGVVLVEDTKSFGASLGLKESYGTSLQMEGTPLCPTSTANTLHDSNVHSLPPLAKSTTQLGLTRPTQRVTPTSKAPLSLPRSQPVGKGRTAAMKTTPTVKLGKSSSSHTPITSRMQQSQTPRVKLHLGSPVVTSIPRATGLPPHPQRKAVTRHLVPRKAQATALDGLHHRGLWHNNVTSPLAKELRNNPPPPLVTNVKSSSYSPGRWQPSPSQLPRSNFSKGSKAQKITAEGTPSSQVCLGGKDDQVLPVANYKTGKSIILDKNNKENIRRQCCKKTDPAKEVKVIKHAGRLMVAKSQTVSQSRKSERTSLMEVSIHQRVSND